MRNWRNSVVNLIYSAAVMVIFTGCAFQHGAPNTTLRFSTGSFIRGVLLHGFNAPIRLITNEQPVPSLIKIQDLTILQTTLKRNIKDCFVKIEGFGSLADQRAHMRATRFSCSNEDGEPFIDQPVRGYLVDADGVVGLSGVVVSRNKDYLVIEVLAGKKVTVVLEGL